MGEIGLCVSLGEVPGILKSCSLVPGLVFPVLYEGINRVFTTAPPIGDMEWPLVVCQGITNVTKEKAEMLGGGRQ